MQASRSRQIDGYRVPGRSADVGRPGVPLREPRTVTVHVRQGRCSEASQMPRPETIPGPGRQTERPASWTQFRRHSLRAVSAPVLSAKRDGPTRPRRPSAPDFFFLVRRQTESTIRRLQKPIMKPIILQVPNRDSNFVKMIRPVQGTFSGLQHPPDSDRFTLLIRRFRVRAPIRAPGTDSCPW